MAWELERHTWPVDGEDATTSVGEGPLVLRRGSPALDEATGEIQEEPEWKRTRVFRRGVWEDITRGDGDTTRGDGMRKILESLHLMHMMGIAAWSRRVGFDIGVMLTRYSDRAVGTST
jgi:hypothetical protein